MRAIFIDCPSFLAALCTPEMRELVPGLDLHVAETPVADIPGAVGDAVGVINDHSYMPDEVLAACPALKVIVFMGTGAASFIDVAAAELRGIVVRTISGYGDRSVAEHAVALMFAAVRQVARMDRAVRAGDWQTLDGIELQGRTLGVVGTGGIGAEMTKLGAALGMTVLAWNRSGVPDDLPCAPCMLDAVMARSDVVSLHLGLNDDTAGMIDERRLGLMQPHAVLINTARGAILDEGALVRALQAKRIAHAGLDVFAEEPLPPGHPLTTLDNVTLTGHAAFMTKEASERLLTYAFTYMRDELAKIAG